MAAAFFDAVGHQTRAGGLLSDEHIPVDGAQLEAWARLKSFRPRTGPEEPPPDDPGNSTVDFRGERRRNDSHHSTTEPKARLYRKGPGREATLAYLGHVLLDNRHGLVATVYVTAATGTAEREAGTRMLAANAPPGSTVTGDKGYDVRALEVTPHIARTAPYSDIDIRTTCDPGYEVSQPKRKFVEQVFGWRKTVGELRRLRHRGAGRLDRHRCRSRLQLGAIALLGGDAFLIADDGGGIRLTGADWHRSPRKGAPRDSLR